MTAEKNNNDNDKQHQGYDADYYYKYGISPETSKFPYILPKMIHPLSGWPSDLAREMSVDELMSRSGNITRNAVLSWDDNELSVAWMYLKYVIPLLRRLQEMVDKEMDKRSRVGGE